MISSSCGSAPLSGHSAFSPNQLTELAAERTDPDDQKALRKTAGAVGRLGEGIVDSALEAVGEGLAG